MENLTVQLETQWTSHLDSVGGEHHLFFPSVYYFKSNHHHSLRICAGKHLVHSTVTLAVASVLSTFDLLRQVDKNGREIEPKREYRAAAVR